MNSLDMTHRKTKGKKVDDFPSHRLKLKEAWKRFIETGRVDEAVVRKEIAESWQRCRAYGIDFNRPPTQGKLDPREKAYRLERRKDLIRFSRPFLKALYDIVKTYKMIIVLTDEECVILDSIGEGPMWDVAVESKVIQGYSLHERVSGTNPASIVMHTHAPIQMLPEEYYCSVEHEITCSAAPIFDPSDNMVGILYVTSLSDMAVKNPHVFGMVISAAKAIETHLRLAKKSEKLILSNRYLQATIDQIAKGMIILDEEDRLAHINPPARIILDLDERDIIGKSYFELISYTPLRKLLESGEECSMKEIILGGKKMHARYYVSVNKISDHEGRPVGRAVSLEEMRKVKHLVHRMIGATAGYRFSDILGSSRGIRQAIEMGLNAAGSRSNTLILGESGVGKELMAQSIHNAGPHKDGPFVAINCAALPKDLMESELFGYEEGSFTGASRKGRPGKFELAEGGTLFLDEIDRMPLEMQAKLLRVLEDRKVLRLGGNQYIQVDTRIIAASKGSVIQDTQTGRFRLDLYYRLNVLQIQMPPLRERREDIPALADHFLRKKSSELGKPVVGISQEALDFLVAQDWPGNVRQLENVIERAVHMAGHKTIETDDVMVYSNDEISPDSVSPRPFRPSEALPAARLDETEKQLILKTLHQNHGNISRASNALGISRNTLYRKMKKYQIAKTFKYGGGLPS